MLPLILASLAALASARPEAGYSYPSPSGPIILNGGSSGFNSGGGSFHSGGSSIPAGGSSFISGGGSFTSGGSSFSSGGSSFASGGSSFTSGGTSLPSSPMSSGGNGFTSGGSSFISGGISSGGSYATGYDHSSSRVPLIHKHIYVHVAPPEPEPVTNQVITPTSAPQKHYKLVFIKTPSFPTPAAPIISAQAQNQEKTLIYVLVKRPEDAPKINIPTVAPTQPSKPEVYFIKYKTQKETQTSSKDTTYGVPPPQPVSNKYGPPGHTGY